MPTSDIQVRWADFKGGHAGVRDPSRWDRDEWVGENVLVYRSGLLGPRAGLKAVTVTGLPTHTAITGAAGFGIFGADLLIVIGSTMYKFNQAGGAATAYTAYPSTVTNWKHVEGNGELYTIANNSLYRHTGTGTAAVTTPVLLRHIIRWGLWMVAADASAATPYRIYFNLVDAAGPNYTSWPANNFYDVGNTDGITALKAIFNTLYVGKNQGWWAVTGVLGDLASIRDVAVGRGPQSSRYAAVDLQNRITYWGASLAPLVFNGADAPLSIEDQYRNWQLPISCDGIAVSPSGRVVLAVDDGEVNPIDGMMLIRDGQRWFRHRFVNHRIAGVVPNDLRMGSQVLEPGLIFGLKRPFAIGDAPVVWSFKHDLDRPAHSSDGQAAPSDLGAGGLVSGTVSLPAHWEPNGRQLRATRVIVQIRKWTSGVGGTTNRLRFRVDALGAYGGGVVSSAAQEWSEPSASASATGVDDSVRFDFGDQSYANGFQIVFEAIEGVAIREVVAEVDTQRNR